jgi:hypothetical protein
MAQIAQQNKTDKPARNAPILIGTSTAKIMNNNSITIPELSNYLGGHNPNAVLLPESTKEPRIIIVSGRLIEKFKSWYKELEVTPVEIERNDNTLNFSEGEILTALLKISQPDGPNGKYKRVTLVGHGEYWELWNGAKFAAWEERTKQDPRLQKFLDEI